LKVRAVIALKAEHRFAVLLQIAGLARSTFFYHQARMRQPDPLAELKSAITEAFANSHSRYGHRRVHTVLVKAGWTVAKKTVLKLMQELKLVCPVRRRRRYVSHRGDVGRIATNLLDREFAATAPNQKWVTDVTEFRIGYQKLYLSPVMDLFDRQIISYSMSTSPNLHMTNSSLRAAITMLTPEQSPIVHSDQGFQYQHRSWQNILTAAGATQSMSRKGNCFDNAVMENFFGHLKAECFHNTRYIDRAALRAAIDEYIHWYNHDRISTTLKNLSPVQYRTQALAA
jgi:putative transposase